MTDTTLSSDAVTREHGVALTDAAADRSLALTASSRLMRPL